MGSLERWSRTRLLCRRSTVASFFGTSFERRTGGRCVLALRHPASPRSIRRQHARRAFGGKRPDELGALDLDTWRAGLPRLSRHYIFRAFRQVLEQAVAWELLERNPASRIRNTAAPKSERRAITPFATWEDVQAVADELDSRYRAVPIFAVGTGLRPEEWIALERRDIDRAAGVVHVRPRYTQGELKDGGKTAASVRRVPLRARVLDALDDMPRRIDSPLLFPAARGGHIDLERFRHREWAPAVRAAGIDHRRIYDCRHTFATFAIAAGVQLFYLARIMGTSVAEIDATYGHMLPESEDYLRGLLDEYDEKEAIGGGL